MAATYNVFSTIQLVQLVPNLLTSQNWLLDRFFPYTVTADTEEVAIDVDVGLRRMAPFVSPLVEGKVMEQRRYRTDKFKPAYIKAKTAPDLRKPIRRMIGERIGGEFSAAERELLNMQDVMTDQIDTINRRLEWMAAQALTTGAVAISGDGYDSVSVDFGRDSSLTIALTSTLKWSYTGIASTGGISANINAWQTLILKNSGAVATDIVMSPDAFDWFIQDKNINAAVVTPLWNPSGNVINPGAQIAKGAIFKGYWGQYQLWVYNDWYIDENGIQQPMLPSGTVIMAGADLMGTRAFGAIQDPAFAYGAMAYAPKTWVTEDPAQRWVMTQSSPIVIPSRVNAALCATVL